VHDGRRDPEAQHQRREQHLLEVERWVLGQAGEVEGVGVVVEDSRDVRQQQ